MCASEQRKSASAAKRILCLLRSALLPSLAFLRKTGKRSRPPTKRLKLKERSRGQRRNLKTKSSLNTIFFCLIPSLPFPLPFLPLFFNPFPSLHPPTFPLTFPRCFPQFFKSELAQLLITGGVWPSRLVRRHYLISVGGIGNLHVKRISLTRLHLEVPKIGFPKKPGYLATARCAFGKPRGDGRSSGKIKVRNAPHSYERPLDLCMDHSPSSFISIN